MTEPVDWKAVAYDLAEVCVYLDDRSDLETVDDWIASSIKATAGD